MLFYNALFILPLFSAILVRVVLGERSVPMLNRINDIVTRVGRRVLIVALVIAGAVLIIDGVGWFLGHPLLPVW